MGDEEDPLELGGIEEAPEKDGMTNFLAPPETDMLLMVVMPSFVTVLTGGRGETRGFLTGAMGLSFGSFESDAEDEAFPDTGRCLAVERESTESVFRGGLDGGTFDRDFECNGRGSPRANGALLAIHSPRGVWWAFAFSPTEEEEGLPIDEEAAALPDVEGPGSLAVERRSTEGAEFFLFFPSLRVVSADRAPDVLGVISLRISPRSFGLTCLERFMSWAYERDIVSIQGES